jgi:NAD(P)-dependent dehydrogenase (short-subunit alcohol dehydrogenase family)
MKSGLEGRVALVTGAGSGIGREAAIAFAGAGARVAAADLNVDATRAVVDEIVGNGGEGVAIAVDVSSEASVKGLVQQATEALGGLDAAFNCAGVGHLARLLDVTDEQWDHLMSVNLKGVLYCLRHEILWMRAHGGGAIVNAASRASLGAIPNEVDYVVSKHGVLGLTRVAALEHAQDGIRVNAVAPFFVNTPMLAPFDSGFLEGARAMNPSGRLGEAHEIAEAAVWLCSPRASYVNGIALPLDGGFDAI